MARPSTEGYLAVARDIPGKRGRGTRRKTTRSGSHRRPPAARIALALASSVVMREVLLGLQRGHAARARRGDRLAVLLVLDVAGREHPGDRGQRGARCGQDVALLVRGDLAAQEPGVGHVTDREEQ